MTHLEKLVDTLLWEGHQLYPYTPSATKNATLTPFGIVYPPAYAAGGPHTFARLKLQCIAMGTDSFSATVLCLQGGEERRVELSLEQPELDVAFGPVTCRAWMTSEDFGGLIRVTVAVENTTEVADGLTRTEALESSLLSTHVVVRCAPGGRFMSPIAPPEEAATAVMTCANVNTYPVLATPGDDAILGAAIILPDHPQIAPESRGTLFDNTEIEEALVLHVQVLSDEERAQIAEQDPAVREMIERASAVTSEELSRLHGRVTLSPPQPSDAVRDPTLGLPEVEVDGVVFRRGGRVVVRPGLDADLQARMLEGRTVTVERIQRDYDGRVHLGVALDEPGQEILRETGRFLWFFPPEVEVVE